MHVSVFHWLCLEVRFGCPIMLYASFPRPWKITNSKVDPLIVRGHLMMAVYFSQMAKVMYLHNWLKCEILSADQYL